MKRGGECHLFVLGKDYHLGDLLWFTAVLAEYRQQVQPGHVSVACPQRPISHILDNNPLIDELALGEADSIVRCARDRFGDGLVLHDLRMGPIAIAMIRAWRHRLPWRYYYDLWFEPRGQWLATFLGLGPLHTFRPVLCLTDDDRSVARALEKPLILLAPHVGQYAVPLLGRIWQRLKAWDPDRWSGLVQQLRTEGYHVVTLGAIGQEPVAGSDALTGLPIRQVAGVIEQADALVTVESGLWFIAAALGTPFVIVPWWLPRSVNWPAPMGVPHAVVYREETGLSDVLAQVRAVATNRTE